MLREVIEESAIEPELAAGWVPAPQRESRPDWKTVDRALRAICKRRAALDADEARWLREAEALQIWRQLGMVSMIDYLERVLRYAPRTAQDRMRVARALGELPALTQALGSDELGFSAVRELTRVATPATEAAWIEAARGKTLREIELLVADHRPGDRPDDPPDPQARMHVVRFELAAETFALMRQARTVLDDEHGTNLSDDGFVSALCSAVLDGASQAEPTGRAKFQIAMTVCDRCRQGWQEGAGAQIVVGTAAADRALCDAQHIGSIDGDAPERAYQDIAPSVVRFVWRRDGGRCRVPGCRSARGLEIHHLVHRSDGGGHDASNLALLCSSCHLAHHRGALVISGTADHLQVRRPGAEEPQSPSSTFPVAGAIADAHVGARRAEAKNASEDVARAVQTDAHVGACRAEAKNASEDVARAAQTDAHVGACRAEAKNASEDVARAAADLTSPGAQTDAHVGAGRAEAKNASEDVARGAQTDAHVGACRAEAKNASEDVARAAADLTSPGAQTDAHVGACRAEAKNASEDVARGAQTDAHVGACRAEAKNASVSVARAAADLMVPETGTTAHVGAHLLVANNDASAAVPPTAADPTAPATNTAARVGAARSRSVASVRAREDAMSKLESSILCTQAKSALTGLGWKPAIAHAAVAAAMEQTEAMTLEQLIFESLRRCPAPKA